MSHLLLPLMVQVAILLGGIAGAHWPQWWFVDPIVVAAAFITWWALNDQPWRIAIPLALPVILLLREQRRLRHWYRARRAVR